MNELAKTESAAEPATADTEPAPAAEAPAPAAQAPVKKGGGWIGALALLVALGAAGGTGYQWWLGQQEQGASSARLSAIDTRISAGERERASLGEQLAVQAAARDELLRELASLEERLASQRRQLDELPLRLSRVEQTLDELPGVAAENRTAWLLAEAEYYLRLANAQLQLARNPEVALLAMELADAKLRDVADPGLTPVRARLADEMTTLRALPRPDTEGLVLRIGSLSRELDQLPLNRQGPGTYGQPGESAAEASGWERAWTRLREALLSLIRIKKTDEAVTPLRTAAEESLLLRRLETTLELARLALLQGNGGLYRGLLDDVKNELRRHFDTDAPAVRAAVNELTDLSRAELPERMPDVSGSLDLLRRVGGEAVSP